MLLLTLVFIVVVLRLTLGLLLPIETASDHAVSWRIRTTQATLLLVVLRLLPAGPRGVVIVTARRSKPTRFSHSLIGAITRHGEGIGSRRSGHPDCIWVVLGSALNAVSGRQEGVETLDESRMTIEQRRDALNHSRCVDARACQ